MLAVSSALSIRTEVGRVPTKIWRSTVAQEYKHDVAIKILEMLSKTLPGKDSGCRVEDFTRGDEDFNRCDQDVVAMWRNFLVVAWNLGCVTGLYYWATVGLVQRTPEASATFDIYHTETKAALKTEYNSCTSQPFELCLQRAGSAQLYFIDAMHAPWPRNARKIHAFTNRHITQVSVLYTSL